VLFSKEGKYSISSYVLAYGSDPWNDSNWITARSGTFSTLINVDTVKPSLTVTGIPALWSGFDVTATATASDDTSGMSGLYWGRSIGQFTPYTGPVVFSTEGQQDVYFRAFDNAGNQNLQHFVVKIDKTPPTIDHSDNGRTVTLNAYDAVSGILDVSYNDTFPYGGDTTYTGPFVVPGWGVVRVSYKAQDMVHHVTAGAYFRQMPFDLTSQVRITVGTKRYDPATGRWTVPVTIGNLNPHWSTQPVWLLVAPSPGATLLTPSQPVTEPSETSSRAVDCRPLFQPGVLQTIILTFAGPASGISLGTKLMVGPGPL
jgi:hypothetical protein